MTVATSIDPKTIMDYQTALHREDHYDHEKHTESVPHLEQAWKHNRKDSEHDALCQLHPGGLSELLLRIRKLPLEL